MPTGIFPPDIGGPASYVPRLAAAMSGRGHAVRVISLADDPETKLPEYPFPLRRIRRATPRLLRMVETVRAISGDAFRADVIYANGLFIEAAIAAAIVRKPLVMKIVGDWAWERAMNRGCEMGAMEEFQKKRQTTRNEILKGLRSMITQRADLIIAPSRFLAGQIAAWSVQAERIRVVYNAIEQPSLAGKTFLPDFAGPTIITVARLVRWKGIDALLSVVAKRNEARLVIVGDGPERESLHQLAKELGVEQRVVFTGGVSREQTAALLRASSVFVLNSTYEGLPHIILEAFAIETPVVAAASGGAAELVIHGKNGLLVPPGDATALGLALDDVVQRKDLAKRLREGGRKTISGWTQWPELLDQTEGVLSDAIACRKRHP